MIVVEIKGNELKATEITNKFKKKEVLRTNIMELNPNAIYELEDDYTLLKDSIQELVEKTTLSYKKETYGVVLSLSDTITQQVTIPIVKTREIGSAINSALIKEQVVMSPDSMVAFSVLKGHSKESYRTISQVIERYVVDNITNIFNELGLKLKYIDIAPNALIKLYNASNYIKDERPLDLVVDLSKNEVRYYQFIDKKFSMTYLETVDYSDYESYMAYILDNVNEMIYENSEYKIEDVNVILIGDCDIIKEVVEEHEELNITLLSDNVPSVENFSLHPICNHMYGVGSAIRNDSLLSSQARYDVNLVDRKKVQVKNDPIDMQKALLVIGAFAAVGGFGYLGKLQYDSIKLDKHNKEITAFINDPSVVKQRAHHADLSKRLKSATFIVNSIEYVDNYIDVTARELDSSIIKILHNNTTVGSEIESISYDNGIIEVQYNAWNEASFMNYTARLKAEKQFKRVTYNTYASDGDGYKGVIQIEMKGGVSNENVE